jgi:hypothetical protein
MKQIIYIILLIAFAGQASYAQPQNKNGRIYSIKKSYVEDRINLTAEQRQGFKNTYERYENELRNNRKEFHRENDGQNGSPEYLDKKFQYKEREIEIKRKYKNEFLKVISPQQLNSLYSAEDEFNQMAKEQLRERQGQNNTGRQGPPRQRGRR